MNIYFVACCEPYSIRGAGDSTVNKTVTLLLSNLQSSQRRQKKHITCPIMMKDRKKREQSVPGVGGMGLVPMGSQGKFLCSCDT